MTRDADPARSPTRESACLDSRFHVVRDPRDADARALAHVLAGRGWNIVVSAPHDLEGVNALVADIWDAGGSVRAVGRGPR